MKRLLFSAVLLTALCSNAQRSCHTMENHERLIQEHPEIIQNQLEIESFTQNVIANGLNENKAVITIPVVFHILYNTSSQNISEAQILTQLNVLNNDYRKLNSDISSVPSTFTSVTADCEINFCLATVDPNGNATTGIIRKSTSVSSFSDNDAMKSSSQGGSDAWPSTSYLNIWVCNLGSGLLGYAQFPGGPAATDGVVINYTAFGTTGTAQSPFNKGRTATHEVGHWLNLRHIWGDATCGNDYVSDTPVHNTSNYGCPSHPKSNSCGTNAELFMNYMDYTDDACMYMFTSGQKSRMQALFASGGARASLKTSNGCSGSGGGSTTPVYCASTGSTTNYEWISNVKLNTINNTTTGSGGYADYTSINTSINKGSVYSISLSPFYSGSTYTEYFKVYIDYNKDLDFDDVNELVYTSSGTTSTVSGTFTVPSTASSGTTHMRVIMKDGAISGPCESFTYGETEDYSVNIQSETTSVCNAPTGLSAGSITSSSASLTWIAVSGASSYTVQVKPSTSSSWTSYTANSNSLSLSGLSASTSYNWQVRTNCSSGSSDYIMGGNFTTSAIISTCTDNYESNNSRSAAKSIAVNTNITAKIGNSTDVDWFKFSTTTTNKNISISLSNLPYDYDVFLYNKYGTLIGSSENGGTTNETIKYNNGTVGIYYVKVIGYNSAYSNSACYNLKASISITLMKLTQEEEVVVPKENSVQISNVDVQVFPNPSTNGVFTYEINGEYTGAVEITILDAAGRVIDFKSVDKNENRYQSEINVSDVEGGIYYLQIHSTEFNEVKKLLFLK